MLGVDLVEFGYSLDTLVEDVEREVLVGRVDRIAFQPEAHKDGLDPEDTFEGCDDGDTTATAQTKRTLAEGYTDSFFGCTVSR